MILIMVYILIVSILNFSFAKELLLIIFKSHHVLLVWHVLLILSLVENRHIEIRPNWLLVWSMKAFMPTSWKCSTKSFTSSKPSLFVVTHVVVIQHVFNNFSLLDLLRTHYLLLRTHNLLRRAHKLLHFIDIVILLL